MSRTYRDIRNAKRRIVWDAIDNWGYRDAPEEPNYHLLHENGLTHCADDWRWWAQCPKSWNKAYHIKPHRAKEHAALKRVMKLEDYEDYVQFPVYGKPHIYYW